jgi:hypothetical protein
MITTAHVVTADRFLFGSRVACAGDNDMSVAAIVADRCAAVATSLST